MKFYYYYMGEKKEISKEIFESQFKNVTSIKMDETVINLKALRELGDVTYVMNFDKMFMLLVNKINIFAAVPEEVLIIIGEND